MTFARLRFGAIFAFALCVSAALPAFADEAPDLLAKHQAFMGWKFGDAAMLNVESTDTSSEDPTKPLFVEHTLRVGTIYRTDIQDVKGNTKYYKGFTGNLFWYSDDNGFTVPVQGDPARFELADDVFFSDALEKLPWKVTGKKHIWDKDYTVVRISADSTGNIDLYVDPQTGAYGGAVMDAGGDYEKTYHILAYGQAAPGKQMIVKWKQEDSKATHVVDQFHVGGTITNDELHPPARTAQWTFANTAPFPITLNEDEHRVIIKAKVNGVEGTFLLDSGAANIFLSGAFARRAGLTSVGHIMVYTLYGTQTNDTGKASSIEIGGNTLSNVTVYFGSPNVEKDAPDGLMGFDLLAGAFVTLDFDKATLQFQDPETVDPTKVPGVHVAADLSEGQPQVKMQIQGKTVTVNTILDTGSPAYVLVAYDLPSKYRLNFSTPDGQHGCGSLDDMTLGPIVYQRPITCTAGMEGRTALVGYDFLKGLGQLHFDYSRGGLIMTPKAKP